MGKQLNLFKENYSTWKEAIKKYPTRNFDFKTLSDEALEPCYFPKENNALYLEKLGFPGQYPYTRSIHANLYRGRLWTMRQFAGFGSPEETNRRFKLLLKKGQTGLSVAYDMPTLMGYDPGHSLSRGEVGKCGVSVFCLDDMRQLFKGIDLSKISVSQTINGPAIILFAFYVAVAEDQGAVLEELNGTLQNDILKEFIAQKEWIFPPEESMRLVTDMVEFCIEKMPKYNPISISGYHIREAGSTAGQELAFTLANGFTYIEYALKAGLNIDDFAPRLSFFFNSHLDFFEEIAKFRAARRIWAKRLKNIYKAKNNKSLQLRFHTQTAGCSLTAQQPEINIARTGFQAMAAVLGGTQSLHTNSMDETLALPTEKAAEIALRTQQLIAYETGVTNVVDPLGGSWFIEQMTDKIEEIAEEYFTQIDHLGGVIPSIENGYQQKEISKSSSAFQKKVDSKERIVVGVNDFINDDETINIPVLEIDSNVEKKQLKQLKQLKLNRNNGLVKEHLSIIQKLCKSDKNIIPSIIDAGRSGATIGEIVSAMKTELGEWNDVSGF